MIATTLALVVPSYAYTHSSTVTSQLSTHTNKIAINHVVDEKYWNKKQEAGNCQGNNIQYDYRHEKSLIVLLGELRTVN